jgi:hypothetical protein
MNKIDFLTRWKIQLEARDHQMNLVALVEIVDFINNLYEENRDEIFILLINSDICHFLQNLMSYPRDKALKLINKIVCSFSETDEFFKSEFFKIMKGYTKVLNSFPKIWYDEHREFQKNVLVCIGIIIKR